MGKDSRTLTRKGEHRVEKLFTHDELKIKISKQGKKRIFKNDRQ